MTHEHEGEDAPAARGAGPHPAAGPERGAGPERPLPGGDAQGLSRRTFLRRLGTATTVGMAGLAAAGCTAGRSPVGGHGPASRARRPTTGPSGRATRLADGPVVRTAGWVQAENARPGTTAWAVHGRAIPHALDAFADRASTAAGETVTLYVSSQDPSFTVEAFRMGWYQGSGARSIWRSQPVAARSQPDPSLTPGVNMVECAWAPSAAVPVTRSWPQGAYLLKVTGTSGQARYVPLVVRDDASRAAYIIQHSVTTWQAYNWWGGYCLYYGPSQAGSIYTGPHGGAGKSFATRSRVVSFDRPYPHDWAYGGADFVGNELPMVILAEKLGLDVSYWTDLDFHARPQLLANHRALISLGHDEYWSAPMFDGALAARDAGVNLMVLGANACFRHIRFQPSPLGKNRRQVCYKVATEDPLYGVDDSSVTSDWPDSPDPRPESLLIGNMYQSNGVDTDLVVAGAGSWLYAGTGLADGDRLAHVVGPEYDGYDPAVPGPRNLEVLAHSPVVAFGIPGYADMTWYTQAQAGGVFATGTNYWVARLSDNQGLFNPGLVGPAMPGVTAPLTRITENVLAVCGGGPAGRSKPSKPTWQQHYPAPTAPGAASNYRTTWPA